jgi:hypothetical protein
MVRSDGQRAYTGWLRRLTPSDRVIYTGLYSIEKPPGYPHPCVKVSFPLPLGSSTVFLRPEGQPDGSFKLISSGAQFGDPGFCRMVETDAAQWRVRYLRTLREVFHVYVDRLGTLRTDHTVRFLGDRRVEATACLPFRRANTSSVHQNGAYCCRMITGAHRPKLPPRPRLVMPRASVPLSM